MGADWYCPECGSRLSYGIYCKKCGEEREFAMRPAGELDRLIARTQAMPMPDEQVKIAARDAAYEQLGWDHD